LRFDLHIHSCHSYDSATKPRTILRVARQRGLAGIAVCDHGTVAGGLAVAAANDDPTFLVIPGAEYATDIGHVVGYFLTAEPELHSLAQNDKGLLPWQPVVQAIKKQGGLVFLAHPFKSPRQIPSEAWAALDGVEAYNSRAMIGKNPRANTNALEAAARYGLAVSAGSDAHWPWEIGLAYWEWAEAPSSPTLADLRTALATGAGRACGKGSPACNEPLSQIIKAVKGRQYGRLPRVTAKLVLAGAQDLGSFFRGNKMEG